jgi:hypothetical protein
MLIDRPGVPGISPNGCSGDNIDVSLHDSSILPVEDQCSTLPALGGTLQPQEPLAAFAGENISGTWTLTVSDNAGADLGTLNTWCLEAIPVDEASTFTVLVVDDTQGDLLVPQAIEEDLQSLGYDTVRVTTAGDDFEPTLSEMHAHDLTLWLTGPGELPSTGPGPATEPEIQSHIESGGCFAISSPGWFSSRGLTPLMSILGVDFAVPDTGLDEVSGLPPFFDMLGTVPVTDPNADQVEAAANAEPAMLGTPGGVAVRRTKPGSPSVYFGFDLVNLPDGDTRRTVLEGIVAMCRDFLFADGAESP